MLPMKHVRLAMCRSLALGQSDIHPLVMNSGFVPVNMATGANNSPWINLNSLTSALVIFYKNAAGSGVEDPTITLLQATDGSGAGSKALNVPANASFTKTGADLSAIPDFTAGVPSTNTLTVAGSATLQALWTIEVQLANLDIANGFGWFRANVADVGSVAQLGGLMYVQYSSANDLAPINAGNKVALIVADFAEDENLQASDLELATFTGSTPIAGTVGDQQYGDDPIDGDFVMKFKTPIGGWRWKATSSGDPFPITIYGFAVLDSSLSTLLAVERLPLPKTLTASGQEIGVSDLSIMVNIAPFIN